MGNIKKQQYGGLNKKARERVRRQSNIGQGRDYIKDPGSREIIDNPQNYLVLPISNKPGEGNPKINILQT